MDALIGHEEIRRELHTLALSSEPPHALLLAGPESTGKRPLAFEYAKLLNCERRPGSAPDRGGFGALLEAASEPGDGAIPCGRCRHCRLIGEGAHPDVVLVAPGDALCKPRAGESHEKHPQSRDIRICQVRGIIELVSRYPFEGGFRVVIIDPAERLGRDATNALLKTLEEPPGHTALVLVTAAPEAILETIISRCRRIDVGAVPRQAMVEGLTARGIAPAAAEVAAEAARGRPGKAIEYAAQPDLVADRERLLRRCATLAGGRAKERLRYSEELNDRYRRDRIAAARELDAWETFWEGELRSAAGGEREEVRELVGALQAVAEARANLLANVQARATLDLMLLTFPHRTLAAPSEGESTADD